MIDPAGDPISSRPTPLASALIAAISVYRYALSPWLGNACRFEPTCSAYASQAVARHGALRGSALAAGRLLRCHPWCDGGCDPVPALSSSRAPLRSHDVPFNVPRSE